MVVMTAAARKREDEGILTSLVAVLDATLAAVLLVRGFPSALRPLLPGSARTHTTAN
jgi:hypothetical protein